MSAYLQVKAAEYTLLIDSGDIRDVMTNRDGNAVIECPGHRVWRGQTLPVIDFSEMLGADTAPRPVAVVLEDPDHGVVVLDVDSAGPMLRLENALFRPLPPLPSILGQAFDGLLVEGDGRAGVLRLRRGAVFTLLSSGAKE